MKRLIIPIVSIAFVLSGCASTGFLGFLATTDSVDQQMAERDAAMREEFKAQKAEIDRMSRNLEELETLRDDTKEAVEQASQSRQSIEELRALIDDLESKLLDLPEQTLRRIIEILQASLKEAEREKG
jgi:septal ring factor EnvC (AmiA/AmiB activator)